MRSFRSLIATSLAGLALGAVPFVAPASASITTTTWDTHDSSPCHTVSGTPGASAGCVGDDYPGTRASGNEYYFTPSSGSGNLYGTAYTVPHLASGLPNTSGTLTPSFLGLYTGTNYGLGVENLPSPNHSVDNDTYTDFVVFKLPYAVNSVTVDLTPFATTENLDVSIFLGTPTGAVASKIASNGALGLTGALAFSGVTLSDLTGASGTGANGFYEETTSGLFDEVDPGIQVTVQTPTTGSYLIVAASLDPAVITTNDGHGHITQSYEVDDFKINSIAGTYNSRQHIPTPKCDVVYNGKLTPCPEPATLAMFGVGVLGLGMMARRRKAVKTA